MAKMQPFWWFLPPPYVYPCWYDECESADGWTMGPYMSIALDSVTKKQGSYSVKITANHVAGGPTDSSYKPVTHCNNIVGLWIRADLPAEGCIFYIRFEKGDGAYMQALLFYSPWSHKRIYEVDVVDPDVGSYSVGSTDYTNGDWVWFELFSDGHQTEAHINGVDKGGGAGYVVSPFISVKVQVDINAPTCSVWLDWIRFFPDWEYPPTYPY